MKCDTITYSIKEISQQLGWRLEACGGWTKFEKGVGNIGGGGLHEIWGLGTLCQLCKCQDIIKCQSMKHKSYKYTQSGNEIQPVILKRKFVSKKL